VNVSSTEVDSDSPSSNGAVGSVYFTHILTVTYIFEFLSTDLVIFDNLIHARNIGSFATDSSPRQGINLTEGTWKLKRALYRGTAASDKCGKCFWPSTVRDTTPGALGLADIFL